MEITLAQLAGLTGGDILCGDPGLLLTGFAGLREATPGDLTFCAGERHIPDLKRSRAGAVLVPREPSGPFQVSGAALIAVNDPMEAFSQIAKRFAPKRHPFDPGIHPSAVVDPGARFNRHRVSIRAGAIIDADVEIGDGTEIGAGCVIGRGVRIGRDCLLHARVTVYHHCLLGDRVAIHSGAVIGADGFGYELRDGRHVKIDQVGIVEIGDDVEIGANTTIDRARFGRTQIGEGTKIDNLVMIGHNCVIGRHVIIVAQAGVAGSTRIGDYSVIAAQAGIAGHLDLASGVVVTAQAGVTTCLLQPGKYMGYPAQPLKEAQRQLIGVRNLPELYERVKRLEAATGAGGS